MGFTGFHTATTDSDWILKGFTGFHEVLLGFTGFY